MKIMIAGGHAAYARPFTFLTDERIVSGYSAEDVITHEPGLVVFCGGADVTPSIYGELQHPTTTCDMLRDAHELSMYDACVDKGIPMVGICRGSQLLTVANGGKLVQHIAGHAIYGEHILLNALGIMEGVTITSTHHQCMYPFLLPDDSYELIAWGHSDNMQGSPANAPEWGIVPEIVWYNKTKCLCIQGHPEYMDAESAGFLYVRSLIERYIQEIGDE